MGGIKIERDQPRQRLELLGLFDWAIPEQSNLGISLDLRLRRDVLFPGR